MVYITWTYFPDKKKTKAVSENCCLDHREISFFFFFFFFLFFFFCFFFQIISVVVSRSFPGISDRRTAYCICVSACLIHNYVILIYNSIRGKKT